MKGGSLTRRLLGVILLSQLLLAGGLVWVGIVFTRRQLSAAFDTELQGRLMSVAALVRYRDNGPGLVFDPSLLPPMPHWRHPAYYQVRSGGQLLANSFPGAVPLPAAEASDDRYWNFQLHGVPYRGLLLPHIPILDTEEGLTGPPAILTVYYAAPELDTASRVVAAGVAIGATSLALLIITLWLAAWLTQRELEPLRALAAQAAAINPRNWAFHPPPRLAATRELRPLIEALERMLERLQAAHQQQREFMADAAHHLKTPVAILKSTLQTALQRPRERDEYIAASQASLQDVERLEQLLQRLLRLARAEQEGALPPWSDVAASCRAAVERVQPLARARGVEIAVAGMRAGAGLHADPEDLELIWLNLLENAVQHSPAQGRVGLAMAGDASRIAVTVRDQGPGIPFAERPHIFERFRRGSHAPQGGFGLGLAIAHALVTSYGGTITLADDPTPGACFQVELPVSAAPV